VIFNRDSIIATEPQGSLGGELYRSNHAQSIPHEEFLVLMLFRAPFVFLLKQGRGMVTLGPIPHFPPMLELEQWSLCAIVTLVVFTYWRYRKAVGVRPFIISMSA
jgi:hypothetical protein